MGKSAIKVMQAEPLESWAQRGATIGVRTNGYNEEPAYMDGAVRLPNGAVVDVYWEDTHGGYVAIDMMRNGRVYRWCHNAIGTLSKESLRRLAVAFAARVQREATRV